MTTQHISAITDIMKERNIPSYMGDEYFGIAFPTTWMMVKNQLEGVYQYRDEGFQMIYDGEIGKFEGVRLIGRLAFRTATTHPVAIFRRSRSRPG